jgi:hypothetical protein
MFYETLPPPLSSFPGTQRSVEIPELEFEISADGKRKIDSLYNIVSSAIFNLGTHVRTTGAGMIDDHK